MVALVFFALLPPLLLSPALLFAASRQKWPCHTPPEGAQVRPDRPSLTINQLSAISEAAPVHDKRLVIAGQVVR